MQMSRNLVEVQRETDFSRSSYQRNGWPLVLIPTKELGDWMSSIKWMVMLLYQDQLLINRSKPKVQNLRFKNLRSYLAQGWRIRGKQNQATQLRMASLVEIMKQINHAPVMIAKITVPNKQLEILVELQEAKESSKILSITK